MLAFHLAAGLYALFMLARHGRGALARRPVSILACLAALAVLLMAARGLLGAPRPG